LTSKRETRLSNTSYHHKNLKEELIHQGLLLLDRDGYDKFSLRKVASACNVSQTAPYRHFKSKDDLITAIVMEAMQAFDEKLSESFQKYPADPEMLLKEMGIAYVHFFYENPEYLRLLFSSRLFEKIKNNNICGDGNKSTAKGYSEIDPSERAHPFATFQRAIQNFASLDEQKRDINELTLYCWGLVHGIATLLCTPDSHIFPGDVLKTAENILWNAKI